MLVERRHGVRGARFVGGSRHHRPRLRDRIDSTFAVRGGTQWRSVVEEGTQVPVAVPTLALQRCRQRGCMLPPDRDPPLIAATLRECDERRERGVKEPAEPDTLTLATGADQV